MEPEKKTRRSRKQSTNRQFSCPCGKSYLSYPALFTHIKNKHDGKVLSNYQAPGRIKKPNTEVPAARGRPKSNQVQHTLKTNIFQEINDQALSKIQMMLAQLSQELAKQKIQMILSGNQNQDYQILIKSFPKEPYFSKDDYEKILYQFKKISQNQVHDNQFRIPFQKELIQVSVNKILGLFLYESSKHLTLQIFREFCFFVCLLGKSLNRDGHGLPQAKLQIGQYCQINNGKNIIEYMNAFYVNDIPEYEQKYKEMKNFGIVNSYKGCLSKLIYHFAQWMGARKFTNQKLEIS